MPAFATALWYAQFVLQALAAIRIWRSGLVHRFPILMCWFAVSAVFSFVLLQIRWSANYAAVYSIACLFVILLESGCIVEVFFALCGKFRNFAKIGGTLLLVLWAIGIATSAALRLSFVPSGWTKTWNLTLIGARYADLAMVVVVAAAWLILRIPPIPIARSANRVALIILGHALYGFIVSSITISRNNHPYWWMVALPLLGGSATAALAATLLRTETGEYAITKAPSREKIADATADSELAYNQFRQRSIELLRGLDE